MNSGFSSIQQQAELTNLPRRCIQFIFGHDYQKSVMQKLYDNNNKLSTKPCDSGHIKVDMSYQGRVRKSLEDLQDVLEFATEFSDDLISSMGQSDKTQR